jgi:pimeloyl-ACP methyl ester carboxylesterase
MRALGLAEALGWVPTVALGHYAQRVSALAPAERPGRRPRRAASVHAMSAVTHWVPVAPGVELAAYVSRPTDGASGTVVMCHGFASDAQDGGFASRFASLAASVGLRVVRFDFSGNGNSPGNYRDVSLSGQRRELRTVLEALVPPDGGPLVLIGASFGGSAVVHVGRSLSPPPAGIVLWNPSILCTASLEGDAGGKLARLVEAGRSAPNLPPWAYSRVLEPDFYYSNALVEEMRADNTAEVLASIAVPVLAFHSRLDSIVPHRYLVEVARAQPLLDVRLLWLARHGLRERRRLVHRATLSWIRDRVAASERRSAAQMAH